MKKESICTENSEISIPWLSVIIPIYNAEQYLEKCLESILEQTYTNFEVLLVDDASTDSSAEICRRYASVDERIQYLRKENSGAYLTRIYGVERARGTYFTFCDADDYYTYKHAFMRIYEELNQEQYDALQFGYVKKYNHLRRKVRSSARTVSVQEEQFVEQEYPKLLCSFWERSHLTMQVWNKVYHRKLLSNLKAVKGTEKIFWGEDLILNLHLLSTCRMILFIPDTLYCYVQFRGGTSKVSLHTMQDLNNIKKYQQIYLSAYHGKDKEEMERILFSEMTGWLFYYTQQVLDYFGDAVAESMLAETFQLSEFSKARAYYSERKELQGKKVELLRKADVKEYIMQAKESSRQRKQKECIKRLIRKIYYSL